MNEFKQMLEGRMKELKQIVIKMENAIKNSPDTTVHIANSRKNPQFYFNNNGKRTYANQKDQMLVTQLCQKDYNQRILAKAKQELKELERLYKNYDNKTYESVYEKLHPVRQQLINPIWLPDEEFVKQWEAVAYTPKGFSPESPEFYTDKGERVRSKSEILIANALKKHHVPYRFEYPYQFEPYGPIFHPDFTVLNVRTRKEYIWEHSHTAYEVFEADHMLTHILKNDLWKDKKPGDKIPVCPKASQLAIVSCGGSQGGHGYFMGPVTQGNVTDCKVELPKNWDNLLLDAEIDLGPIPATN